MVILQLEEQPSLTKAIFAGEVDEVKLILDNSKLHNQDVNDLDIEKRSALHAAAFKGDSQLSFLLLNCGARVNAKDNKWLTPLHRACYVGSEETVAVLLSYQAETSARDRFWQTPLHVAASNGAAECVSQLLNVVPNANVTDRSGHTALHHAAFNGHNNVIELLLSKGCIVNACDKKDCRPLHWAAHMGQVDTIELLLRHGAEINARDRNQYTPLHVAAASGMVSACRLLLNSEALVDVQNAYGNTPFHIACLNGHLPICQELFANGADVEAVNYRGQTPLHIAAASTHGVDCLNFLLEQNVIINKQNNDGRTPLHMTAIHGRFTRSKTLIDKGAIVDAVDKNGCTALHIAAQCGHELLSNTLLMFGADPSKKGFEGRTPLHMCCQSGYVECCRKFLQAGVDLNEQDNTGKAPMHYAAYRGSVECLDLLVSNSANFEVRDNLGRIPLHYAAMQAQYNCVLTLVGIGSDVNQRDNEGCTPLHLASVFDIDGKCVEHLLRHKAEPRLMDNKGFVAVHYAVSGVFNCLPLAHLLKALGRNYKLHEAGLATTTVLHIAARSGIVDVMKMVIPFFKDLNKKDRNGCTPLLLAASEGRTTCVQVLLRSGAKAVICDNLYNMNPIHHSAKNGDLPTLGLLLNNCGNKTLIDRPDSLQRTALMLAVSSGRSECVEFLLECNADPNIVDADLHSAIFRAVVTGQNSVAQLLLSKGAKVDKTDAYGKTVLHLAAACGHFACLQTILNCMSEEVATRFDKQNCTAIHWAAYNGNQDCLDYLLQKNFFKKMEGNTFSPVHCASFSGFEKCLDLLCKHYGPEIIKLIDARNRTPLHIASLHGQTECAKYLLKQGAEINCQDGEGRSPLLSAALNGQTEVMELLISEKADLTSYDKNGNTALHLACLKKHNHSALLLLEYIDDPEIINMINNHRRTSLHLSARNGMVDVTRQLISKGSSVVAVDASGLTPALSCATNVSVAQCLAIILASYPKQASLDSDFLSKGIPDQHYLSLFPQETPKSKTEILQSIPKKPELVSQSALIKNRFRVERQRSDLRLSKLNSAFSEPEPKKPSKPETVAAEDHVTYKLFTKKPRAFSRSVRNEISHIFECSKSDEQAQDCYIIENFRHNDEKKADNDQKGGFELHRSSTSMSLTSHKIYSDDDYKEIVRNTHQDIAMIPKNSGTMKPFPRRTSPERFDTLSTNVDSSELLAANRQRISLENKKQKGDPECKPDTKPCKRHQKAKEQGATSSTKLDEEIDTIKLPGDTFEEITDEVQQGLEAKIQEITSQDGHNMKFRTTRKFSDIRYKLQLKKSAASTEIKSSKIYTATAVGKDFERKKVKPRPHTSSIKSGNSMIVLFELGDKAPAEPAKQNSEHALKVIETYSTDLIANVEDVIHSVQDDPKTFESEFPCCSKTSDEEKDTIQKLINIEDSHRLELNSAKSDIEDLQIIKDVNLEASLETDDSADDIFGENLLCTSRSVEELHKRDKGPIGDHLSVDESNDIFKDYDVISTDSKDSLGTVSANTCVNLDEMALAEDHANFYMKSCQVNLMQFAADSDVIPKPQEPEFSRLFLGKYLAAHEEEKPTKPTIHVVNRKQEKRPVFQPIKFIEHEAEKEKEPVFKKQSSPPIAKIAPVVAKVSPQTQDKKLLVAGRSIMLNKMSPNILDSQKFDFRPNLCEVNLQHLKSMQTFNTATNCCEKKSPGRPLYLKVSQLHANVRELYLGDETKKPAKKDDKLTKNEPQLTEGKKPSKQESINLPTQKLGGSSESLSVADTFTADINTYLDENCKNETKIDDDSPESMSRSSDDEAKCIKSGNTSDDVSDDSLNCVDEIENAFYFAESFDAEEQIKDEVPRNTEKYLEPVVDLFDLNIDTQIALDETRIENENESVQENVQEVINDVLEHIEERNALETLQENENMDGSVLAESEVVSEHDPILQADTFAKNETIDNSLVIEREGAKPEKIKKNKRSKSRKRKEKDAGEEASVDHLEDDPSKKGQNSRSRRRNKDPCTIS